jgi:hypothetical protein
MVLAWFFDITLHGLIKDTGSWIQSAEVVAAAQSVNTRSGPSIAVLSFDDMSPGKDQEYLCDGIAEEILNRLEQILLKSQNFHVASSPPYPRRYRPLQRRTRCDMPIRPDKQPTSWW